MPATVSRIDLPFIVWGGSYFGQFFNFSSRLHSGETDEGFWTVAQEESGRLAITTLENALKLIRSGFAANLTERTATLGISHSNAFHLSKAVDEYPATYLRNRRTD